MWLEYFKAKDKSINRMETSVRSSTGKFQCPFCLKRFQSEQSIKQHLRQTHHRTNIMCDVEITLQDTIIRELVKNGYILVEYPSHGIEWQEHEILNYIKQKNYSFITNRENLARKASGFTYPVYIMKEKDGVQSIAEF